MMVHDDDGCRGEENPANWHPGKDWRLKVRAETGGTACSAADYVLFGETKSHSVQAVYETIKGGAAVESVMRLASALNVNPTEATHLINLSGATLKRCRDSGRLTSDESDRVYRYARLLDLATAMMGGDKGAAQAWLKETAPAFGRESPLEMAKTEFGAHQVENLIGRIRRGIPT